MTGDGGFERDFVDGINDTEKGEDEYYAYRRKQHRFSSQDIDVLIDSRDPEFFCGVENKSKQIDVEKANKDNNQTETKLYFSNAFSTDKNGVHQIEKITDFLKKTGRKGAIAIAYRRGAGRKVHYYAMGWDKVWEIFQDEDRSGITKVDVEEHGVPLHNARSHEELQEMKRGEIEEDWSKVFEVVADVE